jgi:hypothetical protein
VTRLQQNRPSVVFEELSLAVRERPNFDDPVGYHSHPIQGWDVSYRGDDQDSRIFKTDKAAIKEMVDCRSQQQPIFAVEPLFIARVPPGLAMASSQMGRFLLKGER